MRQSAALGQARNPKARLNFVLPPDLEAALEVYEQHTGRKQSSVIRQLVVEWINGHSTWPALPEGKLKHPEGRRTNIHVTQRVRNALDARLAEIGSPTVSAVIAALLGAFLAHRAPDDGDTVTLTLRAPADLLNQFAALCHLRGETVDAATIEMIRERVRESVDALKETA